VFYLLKELNLYYLQVKGMITDFGDDMHCQFLEILRSLLDSYTLSGAQVLLVLIIHSLMQLLCSVIKFSEW
jgi:hypothetical protein